ncbi:MAG: alpha/beta hydrolase, partial [Candidatus Thiodiazotropha endolucinida]
LSLQVVWGGGASNSERRLEAKIYLDLQDVKEFYETWTFGTAQNAGADTSSLGCPDSIDILLDWPNPGFPPIEPIGVQQISGTPKWIYQEIAQDDQHDANKVYLVHGWRMLDDEKKHFADSTFKRLYWSGYQGQFAAVNWPTGWFDKPSHCYGIENAILAKGHAQNYNQSEIVARLTGARFNDWLVDQQQQNSETALHLIAHSMGNVVVSEALRHATGRLVESYTATQAAEVGGGYDDSIPDMLHENVALGLGLQTPKLAWEWYNAQPNEDSDYAMPPDIYRFTNMIEETSGEYAIRHMQTDTEERLRQQFGAGAAPYYHSVYGDISGKAGRILNFFNTRDAALEAWEFNQLTKPDTTPPDAPRWDYGNAQICTTDIDEFEGTVTRVYPDGSECPVATEQVASYFYRNRSLLNWDPATPVDGSVLQTNFAQIMAHIIPARTDALGQLEILPADMLANSDFGSFTSSNQGHSGQFHGYLSEPGRNRYLYWRNVLDQSLQLNPRTDYSGL